MSERRKVEEERPISTLSFEEQEKLNEAYYSHQKEIQESNYRNQRELIGLFFDKLNNTIKTVSTEYLKFSKLKRKAAILPSIIMGMIIIGMLWLTMSKIVSQDALTFLLGTIAGYLYAILKTILE